MIEQGLGLVPAGRETSPDFRLNFLRGGTVGRNAKHAKRNPCSVFGYCTVNQRTIDTFALSYCAALALPSPLVLPCKLARGLACLPLLGSQPTCDFFRPSFHLLLLSFPCFHSYCAVPALIYHAALRFPATKSNQITTVRTALSPIIWITPLPMVRSHRGIVLFVNNNINSHKSMIPCRPSQQKQRL